MNIFRHKAMVVALLLLVMAVVGRWWMADQASRKGQIISPITVTDAGQGDVLVQIDGAVQNPGVYRITADAHVMELIFLAGGLLPDARVGKVNLAKVLEDGDRIHILGPLKPRVKSTKTKRKKKQNGK